MYPEAQTIMLTIFSPNRCHITMGEAPNVGDQSRVWPQQPHQPILSLLPPSPSVHSPILRPPPSVVVSKFQLRSRCVFGFLPGPLLFFGQLTVHAGLFFFFLDEPSLFFFPE